MKITVRLLIIASLLWNAAEAMRTQDDFKEQLTRGRLPAITDMNASHGVAHLFQEMHSASSREKSFVSYQAHAHTQPTLKQYKWMWASPENQVFIFRNSDQAFPPLGTLSASFAGSHSMQTPHEYVFKSIETPDSSSVTETIHILAFSRPLQSVLSTPAAESRPPSAAPQGTVEGAGPAYPTRARSAQKRRVPRNSAIGSSQKNGVPGGQRNGAHHRDALALQGPECCILL